MNSETPLQIAETIARDAHVGQMRRDLITPYITHVKSVVAKLSSEREDVRAAGWLHDVLEDTPLTATHLRIAGIPDPVISAVELLTCTDPDYREYLQRIRANEIARKVKIADMLANLGDAPTEKQIVRYAHGLLYLHYQTDQPNISHK